MGGMACRYRFVFPACAGMFRRPGPFCAVRRGFPRIRGDVPGGASSPQYHQPVFPAYAGMFLITGAHTWPKRGFPRIRGDVPPEGEPVERIKIFSPHTRGCSDRSYRVLRGRDVFPAYAGMFLVVQSQLAAAASFPRIRGDVPKRLGNGGLGDLFSPHTRGCS